jgi:hypothetical protein
MSFAIFFASMAIPANPLLANPAQYNPFHFSNDLENNF